jgi:predicted anti-sigma-YlaC factor YlaD
LDSFAEARLSGSDATAAMPLVGDHLDKCEDCRGKLEALLRALRSA